MLQLKEQMQKDILTLQEQVEIIANGAEGNAAATEEVNASSEELAALLETIHGHSIETADIARKLGEEVMHFKLNQE